MNATARIRLAIILTGVTLLGILSAAVLLLFHGPWRAGAFVTEAIVRTHNGRQSATWKLAAHRQVGIQITTSDPAYSHTWADRDKGWRGRRWDRITVTLSVENGSFVLGYNARAKRRGTGGGENIGSGAKSLIFTDLHRGCAAPGTVLGRFTLETQDRPTVEGKVSLVEVTEELLDPFKRSDANDGREENAD